MLRPGGTAARRAESLVLAQPGTAVADARTMIAGYNEDAALRADEVPVSLRIPDLRSALLHRDHVDLVVLRQVDEESGFRIWSVPARVHQDTPPCYRDVYYYSYSNDFDESPGNIY
jgi:hypothetical protein